MCVHEKYIGTAEVEKTIIEEEEEVFKRSVGSSSESSDSDDEDDRKNSAFYEFVTSVLYITDPLVLKIT